MHTTRIITTCLCGLPLEVTVHNDNPYTEVNRLARCSCGRQTLIKVIYSKVKE